MPFWLEVSNSQALCNYINDAGIKFSNSYTIDLAQIDTVTLIVQSPLFLVNALLESIIMQIFVKISISLIFLSLGMYTYSFINPCCYRSMLYSSFWLYDQYIIANIEK